jgi:hypothetical protein
MKQIIGVLIVGICMLSLAVAFPFMWLIYLAGIGIHLANE